MGLDDRLLEIQRSEGLLRTKDPPDQRRTSKMEHYHSNAEERKTRREPHEVRAFGNSYGGVEIGVDRCGRLSVLVSAQRLHNRPSLQAAMRGYDSAHGKTGSEGGSYFHYNGSKEEKSALLFQESGRRTNTFIYRNLLRIFQRTPRDVMQGVLPFYQPDMEESSSRQTPQERRFYQFLTQSLDAARKMPRPPQRENPFPGGSKQVEDNEKKSKTDERRNQFF